MKKIIFTLTAFIGTVILTTGVVSADPKNCKPIYGGGETCKVAKNFSVDKRIQDPKSKDFVDNLDTETAVYAAGQTINFALTVTNTSNNAVNNIQVTDTFPQYVDFAEGNGKYDTAKRTLTFAIAKLNGNESKTYMVKAKVVNDLPDEELVCLANMAQGKAGNDVAIDNTQFCLTGAVETQPEKTVTPAPRTVTQTPMTKGGSKTEGPSEIPPVTKGGQAVYPKPKSEQSPATGPEALALIALLPSGVAGYLLRRKNLGN